MANTFNLGGSPLGLISVKSRPTKDGMSTFNGGDSRNINVSSYNLGQKQRSNISDNGQNIESNVSLFTGDSIPNFWANISTIGTDLDTTGKSTNYKGINRSALHNDEIYDTSILNIIEKLSFSPKSSLRPQDFAYLKNVGVFPNNRLMIARRFTEPQKDNIMDKGGNRPLSVLISWVPENDDFINFSYGEEWEDADADFSNVLNNIGSNFGIDKLGGGLEKGLNAVPLQGFTEVLQRKLLTRLGILEDYGDDTGIAQPLPSGNPNIIKMAKKRKTIGYGTAGSGLKANISIKMIVEYEQKFISGIDPTIAWMDLLNNALSFGTSNSSNYGLSKSFANKIKQWTGKGGIKKLLEDIINSLKSAFSEIKESVSNAISDISSSITSSVEDEKTEEEKKEEENSLKTKTYEKLQGVIGIIERTIQETIRKYQVEIMGIAHALTGLPSTPWHITIGNPLRPVFCSGDMLVKDVNLKMGPTLAFNDLPSTMTVEFTLENARDLGMQEILAKFNTGYLRTVNVRKDYITSYVTNDGAAYYEPLNSTIIEEGNTPSSGTSKSIEKTTNLTTTKENE